MDKYISLPVALGMEQTEDSAQIIDCNGSHLAKIEHSPDIDIAREIVHCVNGFDSLLETLERVACVADTAANICQTIAPEESLLFKQDSVIIRDVLAKAKESDYVQS